MHHNLARWWGKEDAPDGICIYSGPKLVYDFAARFYALNTGDLVSKIITNGYAVLVRDYNTIDRTATVQLDHLVPILKPTQGRELRVGDYATLSSYDRTCLWLITHIAYRTGTHALRRPYDFNPSVDGVYGATSIAEHITRFSPPGVRSRRRRIITLRTGN